MTGRPVVNLSLAVNYALGGFEVRGYHVMNLALHILAGLTLWGVLRRTLRIYCRSLLAGDGSNHPTAESPASRLLQKDTEPAAFVMALLWLLHPLLTESVVCVVQRTEVLGGLFYLLTLYCFIRASEKPETGNLKPEGKGTYVWHVLTVLIPSCDQDEMNFPSCRSLLAGDIRRAPTDNVSNRLQAGSYKKGRFVSS